MRVENGFDASMHGYTSYGTLNGYGGAIATGYGGGGGKGYGNGIGHGGGKGHLGGNTVTGRYHPY